MYQSTLQTDTDGAPSGQTCVAGVMSIAMIQSYRQITLTQLWCTFIKLIKRPSQEKWVVTDTLLAYWIREMEQWQLDCALWHSSFLRRYSLYKRSPCGLSQFMKVLNNHHSLYIEMKMTKTMNDLVINSLKKTPLMYRTCSWSCEPLA